MRARLTVATAQVRALRERSSQLPDEYLVALVGDMITEEGLPTYMTMLNTLDGVRDETGASSSPWAKWTRMWTAEENRHGIFSLLHSSIASLFSLIILLLPPKDLYHIPKAYVASLATNIRPTCCERACKAFELSMRSEWVGIEPCFGLCSSGCR